MEAGDEELRRISKKDLSTGFRFDFAGVGLIGFLRRLLISSTYRWCVLRGNFLKSRVITQLPPDKCALLSGRITL
jgi:hypothetical protein